MLHGFLNIDKPAGLTSHDVVAKIRRAAGQRRVGHGGTLDPAATGVLPIALGAATRLLEYLVEGRKSYRATIRFGITTTTDDAEGAVVAEQPVPELSQKELHEVAQSFVGTIQQAPPMYSAIQIGGQRMYDLARRGDQVDLPPRTVEIDRIDLVDWQLPLAVVDVVCGKGTYIRSLARDLGMALGCGAHLQALRRTAVGPLVISDAIPLEQLLVDPAQIQQWLLPPEAAVADWPRIDVDDVTAARVRNGVAIDLSTPAKLVRVHTLDGTLLALLRHDAGLWRPFKVFDWS
jgi:tRNA pseudouridine55 synthase